LQSADAALNAAETTGNAAMIALAQAAVNTANQTYVNAGGAGDAPTTTAPTSTPTSTTAPVGDGTSAIDGGSYPAVTAHQASGEVWAVSDTASTLESGSDTLSSSLTGATTAITAATATTSASAASMAALQAAISASGSFALLSNEQIGAAAASIATDIQALATVVGSAGEAFSTGVEKIATGSTVSSGPLPTGMGSAGEAAPTGVVTIVQGPPPTLTPGIPFSPPASEVPTPASTQGAQQVAGPVPVTLVNVSSTPTPVTIVSEAPQFQSQIALAPPIAQPPESSSGGGLGNVSLQFNFSGANFGANNPAQIQQSIQAAVIAALRQPTALVDQLRSAGARF
jgi:hypothetical protein